MYVLLYCSVYTLETMHSCERMYVYMCVVYGNYHRMIIDCYRLLVSILEESPSPVAVSVACFDIGEYVRYYPRGKKLVTLCAL